MPKTASLAAKTARKNGSDENTTENNVHYKTETRCVKMGLQSSLLSSPLLTKSQILKLTDILDEYTMVISKMLRRASLAYLYYMTCLLAEGKPIPNLSAENDTYWRNWLRIGLKEFGNIVPNGVEKYWDRIKTLLPDTVTTQGMPTLVNRPLNYAATKLYTMINNSLHVPLLKRLQRLAKSQVTAWKNSEVPTTLTAFEVFSAIRCFRVNGENATPEELEFITEARTRLGLGEDDVLYDNVPKGLSFNTHYNLLSWFQSKFEEFDRKQVKLSPVFKIDRHHVHIDKDHFVWLVSYLFQTDSQLTEEDRKGVTPADLKQLNKTRSKTISESLETLKDLPDDPERRVCKEIPLPANLGKRGKDEAKDLYDARRKARNEQVKVVQAAREVVRQSQGYKDAAESRMKYDETLSELFYLVFSPKRQSLKVKKGWRLTPSIDTDGVSVTFKYERQVPSEEPIKKSKKTKNATILKCPNDYNPSVSTVVDNKIVVGGTDPGRSQIATTVVVISEKISVKVQLSRGQYYVESGILREDKAARRRRAALEPIWKALSHHSLQTKYPHEIENYLQIQQVHWDHWWAVATQKTEARAKLTRYIGKRSVMDKYWSKVHRRMLGAAKRAGHTPSSLKYEIAYGSAGLTMPPTGKSEVAVPTCSTYQSCRRVFKTFGDKVTPTWEANTTKICWKHPDGCGKLPVYKMIGRDGKGRLHHCSCCNGRAPFAEEGLEYYRTFHEKMRLRERALRRRGGGEGGEGGNWESEHIEQPQARLRREKEMMRHIEVRGLRFCPECRSFHDRDASSARSIAGLRCLELSGKGRPLAFCPTTKAAATAVEETCEQTRGR